MNSLRKIGSLFCALLVIFINVTYFAVARNTLQGPVGEESSGIYFISENPAQFFFIGQKTSSTGYQGWKVEVNIPGLYAFSKNKIEAPRLKLIRKIFVVDANSYTSCKSVFFYPFHEFS
jgi:hypothetical protein